jgi:predicted dehydrogenase
VTRKLRMGMVGGGPGAFIGPIHKIAAEMGGKIELVAGAFSQTAERSRQAGEGFGIDPARAYGSYQDMLRAERARPDPIDFIVVATPNHLHLPVSLEALQAGIAVMSDKPATATYEEALVLQAAVEKSAQPYALTHTYAGYGMVREARALCASGRLGAIRKVAVEYLQGWLSQPIERSGHKQAEWRSNPAFSGAGGCIGDIGTHAFHMVEYVAGIDVTQINATLRRVVPGRQLDDDCNAMLRFANGASGVLMASQVATGELNELRLRIYGELGSLDWRQQDPSRLTLRWADGPEQTYHGATCYLSEDAKAAFLLPPGHPEGVIEAFSVLYGEFAQTLIERQRDPASPLPPTLPGIRAAVRGMRFIERAMESDRQQAWVKF